MRPFGALASGESTERKIPAMAISWTLEKELRSLVKARTVRQALLHLKLIEECDPDPLLQEVEGWTQEHPETFVYRFRIVMPRVTHEVLLKAIVAFSMTKSLVEIAGEWVARRRLLEGEGIGTSKLYYAKRAVLVEQFVCDKLSDHLKRCPTERLFDQLIKLAGILERHGFCPVSPFHGLKTDGRDVLVTDFGQDLGPPGVTSKRNGHLLREAIRWFEKESGQKVDKARARALYDFRATGGLSEDARWT
jgi:hypothetical protein